MNLSVPMLRVITLRAIAYCITHSIRTLRVIVIISYPEPAEKILICTVATLGSWQVS